MSEAETQQKQAGESTEDDYAATVEFESEYRDYYGSWRLMTGDRCDFARGLMVEIEDIDSDSVIAGSKADSALEGAKRLDNGLVGEIADFHADLLIFPDDRRLFIGEDPTSKETVTLFGFIVDAHEPIPLPSSVEEAVDLLKPAGVKQALEEGTTAPQRQGEWWLLDTDEEPAGSAFSPGVSERPFGGSPLENHVPREYGLAVSDNEFMRRFAEACPELDGRVSTPHEAFEQVWRGWEIASFDGVELQTDLPELRDLRRLAEQIYVRGTLRHRNNEHYMEKVGEGWKIAQTHHVEVYTADNLQTITVRRD